MCSIQDNNVVLSFNKKKTAMRNGYRTKMDVQQNAFGRKVIRPGGGKVDSGHHFFATLTPLDELVEKMFEKERKYYTCQHTDVYYPLQKRQEHREDKNIFCESPKTFLESKKISGSYNSSSRTRDRCKVRLALLMFYTVCLHHRSTTYVTKLVFVSE